MWHRPTRAGAGAVAVAAALIVLWSGTGCGSTSASRVSPTTARPVPSPVPRTLDVVGDSVNAQSYWGRDAEWMSAGVGAPPGFDIVKDGFLGNRIQAAVDQEAARVGDRVRPRPQILVVALGTSNASLSFGQKGWTAADGEAFGVLINTPSPRTCVVVLLPAPSPGAAAPVRAQFATMRPVLRRVAGARPRTVIVDWQDVLRSHPEYADPGGVHLARDHALPGQQANPEAADAFAALLWSGVARCPT